MSSYNNIKCNDENWNIQQALKLFPKLFSTDSTKLESLHLTDTW